MKQRIGYIFVFLIGFALCAALLTMVPIPFLRGQGGSTNSNGSTILGAINASAANSANPATEAGPQGREQIGKALAREPVVAEPKPQAGAGIVGTSAVADAAAKVEPAVVNIDITGTRRMGGMRNPFGFPGEGSDGFEQRFSGSGSGIILSADGYVVTNNHVVEPVAERGNGTISIRLDNDTEYTKVRIVGRDPESDLAVLKIEGAKSLPAAALGDSDTIRVGDWAIAVGNPLGLSSSVTLGIISAVNRNFRADSDALDRVIQTDAAINPGNSGGALADINGQVIGINTAIATGTGQNVGIGFAIPINTAKRIVKQLVENGKVVRPYIGVQYQPLSALDRDAVKQQFPGVTLPTTNEGSVIMPNIGGAPGVVPGSPADKAGLRAFDVIVAVDGVNVTEKEDVRGLIEGKKPGEPVALSVWRDGKTQQVTLTLGTRPQIAQSSPQGNPQQMPSPGGMRPRSLPRFEFGP